MRRLVCLDGLRGLLALYVMVSHILPFAVLPAGLGWLAALFAHGGAAVDVFFILSGLVISRSLHSFRGQPGGFLFARACRIFPVYLIALALALALRPLDHGLSAMPWIGPDSPARVLVSDGWPDRAGWEIAAHLLMLHGMFPDGVAPDVWVRFLGAAWSLSTEWQFYALALLLALRGVRGSRLALCFLALAAAGLAWHMVAPAGWEFSRAFLPNKAQYFGLGIASAALLPGALVGSRAGWRLYGVALAGCLLLGFDQGGPGKLAAPLAWTACLMAELGLLAPLAALLRDRRLLWLGAVSYPLYIVHEPIHKALSIPLAALAGGYAALFTALWLPTAIFVPLLAAWWLHGAVERPAQLWGRRVAAAARLTRAPV